MLLESFVGIVLVVGFCVALAAVAVPVVAFISSFAYRIVIAPVLNKMPVGVQKVLRPLLVVPDLRPAFMKKQKAKRAR